MTNRYSLWPSSWSSTVFSLILAGLSLAVAASLALQSSNSKWTPKDKRRIRFACLGNSIQYYNDCPRLLERMFQAAGYEEVYQNSCLRGGASIITLWQKGNGMKEKFQTPNALKPDGSHDIGAPTVKSLLENDGPFDFAIINDHTQSPARESSREETIKLLQEEYVPLFVKHNITPVFLQTAAYRKRDIRGTEDLGDFDRFTKLLQEGYQRYQKQLDTCFKAENSNNHQNPQSPQLSALIAPVGLAVSHLYHSDRALWDKLYDGDNFHPSPHGTLLQAYVLYMTMTRDEPPTSYDETTWWDSARRMQVPSDAPLPRPTKAEAEVLRNIAIHVVRQQYATVVDSSK